MGASEYVPKPVATGAGTELDAFYRELYEKICALAAAKKSHPSGISSPAKPVTLAPQKPLAAPVKALAIASSTGGPQALIAIFAALKGQLRHLPIFVTQHMPATFTTILAEHISKTGDWPCHEGRDGEVAGSKAQYGQKRTGLSVV